MNRFPLKHLLPPALLLASALGGQTLTFVDGATPLRVLVPTSEPPAAWRTDAGFSDASWTAGTGGAGYERGTGYEGLIRVDVGAAMYRESGTPDRTCLVRVRFNVDASQRSDLRRLTLRMRYDDGFIAWLNGVRIAENLAPADPAFDSRAMENHESGTDPELFDVTDHLDALREGVNLLAVQGFNVSSNSSDFLVDAGLTGEAGSSSGLTSNLPIVLIDTRGQGIPSDRKITADMGVVDNGPGARNAEDDPFGGFAGLIGIETRGSTSQSYPKKQYAFETRNPDGSSLNTALLGMPAENDWILYAPFTDRSLMRDVLVYRLSNAMGRYAPRSRYCELVLNGEYRGVYVLLEKIKRDRNRVAVSELRPEENAGDSLTGGYIIKVDKWDGENVDGFWSERRTPDGVLHRVFYQYHYPKPDSITGAQRAYIQGFIADFETLMAGPGFADPVTGYAAMIDTDTFVDFFILNEICKNVDGYRLSTFFHKDRDSEGGKLRAGPVWDFNLAFGNANYYDAWDTDDWEIDQLMDQTGGDFAPPFWWPRLVHNRGFAAQARARWEQLRGGLLAADAVNAMIDAIADTLDEAQARNFDLWPGPGEPGIGFWPVPDIFYTFESYADEVGYLKEWLGQRLEWMDDAIRTMAPVREPENPGLPVSLELRQNFPNPFNASTAIPFLLPRRSRVRMRIFDSTGRLAAVAGGGEIFPAGRNQILFTAPQGWASGVYLVRMEADTFGTATSKILYLR
jgi:hypothetical protein